MLYYSELLHKFFTSEKQCQKEENDKREESHKRDQELYKLNKELEAVTERYEESCRKYSEAEKLVEELSDKYLKEVDSILEPARKEMYDWREKVLQAKSELTSYQDKSKDEDLHILEILKGIQRHIG